MDYQRETRNERGDVDKEDPPPYPQIPTTSTIPDKPDVPSTANDTMSDGQLGQSGQLGQKKIFGMAEQKSTARQIFEELALKNTGSNPGMEKEVLEPKFREELASSGFKECDIDIIIKDMENDGLERIST